MKKIISQTTVCILCLISAFNALAQTEVSVYPQPDSPLQIFNVVAKTRKSNDFGNREMDVLTVDFNVQNIGDKPIRAYTIRQLDNDLDVFITSYRLSAGGMLKANQSSNDSFGETGSTQRPKNFRLAVDFIEFADGTTWGEDFFNSAPLFAGVKAGIKLMLENLKEINQKGGIEAVIKTLDQMKELTTPAEQDEKWKRGFKIGSNSIKSRLKRVYETEREKGVETELQKSFDAYLEK